METRGLALVPLAVALNVALAFVVAQFGLPVYLDTVGTVLATLLGGLGAGVAAGLLSQALSGLQIGAYMLAFAPLQVLAAVLARGVAERRGFASTPRSVAWGLALGLVMGLVSSVIAYLVFKGVTATGTTAVTSLLRGLGLSLPEAVVVASVGTDVLDKGLALPLVALALRALPDRMLVRSALARRAVGRA